MKKVIILAVLLYSSFSYGQEYGVWYTSIDYFIVARPGGTRVSHYYSVDMKNVIGTGPLKPEVGVYEKGNQSPINMTVGVYGNALSQFEDKKELKLYEHYVGGSEFFSQHRLEKVSSNVADLKRFYFYAILLPFYTQPIDNNRASSDLLFKTRNNSFNDVIVNIPEIVWKYNYDNKGFRDFPSNIKHNFPMKSTVKEILKDEVIATGKKLYVKAVLNTSVLTASRSFNNEKLPTIESGMLGFNIISSSPELQGPILTHETKCNYTNDGSFTLNFKRDLNSGELLAITLYQKNTLNGLYNVIPDNGQIFGISSLANKSFTWPTNLPGGSYKLKYQTYTGTLTANDPSWSNASLKHSDEFIINRTVPVNFSVTRSANEHCFRTNDGYIEIEATGKRGRSFFYQYSVNGGTNYTGWKPFGSRNIHKINSLGKGSYRIRVRDSRQCMAKG